MRFFTPRFWYYPSPNLLAWLLLPLGCCYAAAGLVRRWWRHVQGGCQQVGIPVICIGNLVAGGAGKTPVALSLASRWQRQGWNVHFLTKGYGGRVRGPALVERGCHTVDDVGDEALLLAECAPSWVSHNRPQGARAAQVAGAQLLILDDGLQDPSLHKDLVLTVVDGMVGFGNRCLIPAGPLRESTRSGLKRTHAIALIGSDKRHALEQIGDAWPVLRAHVRASVQTFGDKMLAFAGIGRPEKFFQTCIDLGMNLIGQVAFPDHHRYSARDLSRLRRMAGKACLVTTAKDVLRIEPDHRSGIYVVRIELSWENGDMIDQLLAQIPTSRRSFGTG